MIIAYVSVSSFFLTVMGLGLIFNAANYEAGVKTVGSLLAAVGFIGAILVGTLL